MIVVFQHTQDVSFLVDQEMCCAVVAILDALG